MFDIEVEDRQTCDSTRYCVFLILFFACNLIYLILMLRLDIFDIDVEAR
jgi:hypothetical protein